MLLTAPCSPNNCLHEASGGRSVNTTGAWPNRRIQLSASA